MRVAAALEAHLVKHDADPGAGQLPGGLATGKTAADHVNRTFHIGSAVFAGLPLQEVAAGSSREADRAVEFRRDRPELFRPQSGLDMPVRGSICWSAASAERVPRTEKQDLHTRLGARSRVSPIARNAGMGQTVAPVRRVCGTGIADRAKARMTVKLSTIISRL